MSLLDQGTHTVRVFRDIQTLDGDGNPVTRPAPTGYDTKATIQPLSSTESAEMGVQTGEVYRLRFTRMDEPELGPGAQIEWMCQRWSIHGYPQRHTGSAATAHLTYRIKRS